MLETAKSWYTGANAEGIENGWDTQFYKNAFTQYDQYQQQAKDAGKGSVFYNWLDPNVNPEATGVATWGAAADDEEAKKSGAMRFGDVFNNGRKVANLYDDYDKATADVMVGEFLFSNDEKRNAWKTPTLGPDGKPQMDQAKYAGMVEEKRQENTDRALHSKSAEAYDDNVRAREVALRDGKGDEGVVAGVLPVARSPVVRSVSRWARYCRCRQHRRGGDRRRHRCRGGRYRGVPQPGPAGRDGGP
jgi:hypothetical protein